MYRLEKGTAVIIDQTSTNHTMDLTTPLEKEERTKNNQKRKGMSVDTTEHMHVPVLVECCVRVTDVCVCESDLVYNDGMVSVIMYDTEDCLHLSAVSMDHTVDAIKSKHAQGGETQ